MDNSLTMLVLDLCAAAARTLICTTCLAYCALSGNPPILYVPETLASYSTSLYHGQILTNSTAAVRVVS